MKYTPTIAIVCVCALSLVFSRCMNPNSVAGYEQQPLPPVLLAGNSPGGLPIDPPTFLEKVALFLHTGDFYDSDDGSNYRRPSGTTTGGLPVEPLTFWGKVEMLFHTAEVESKTNAKKPVEKRDNESQTL